LGDVERLSKKRAQVFGCPFTGELEGLAVAMDIKIEAGEHFYELEYTLPDEP
jgi:hypothetical protein